MANGKRTTLKDVARRAGVSSVTVSYVLNGRKNGPDRISDETRERVMQAVRELHYVPNVAAQNLRKSATARLCLSLPRISVPKYDQLASTLQDTAERRGFHLILTISRDFDGELRVIRQMQSGLADGLMILLERESNDVLREHLETLANSGVAVVAFSNWLLGEAFDVFANSSADAAHEAVKYLVGQAHQRIGVLPLKLADGLYHPRYKSYIQALEANGITVDKTLITEGVATREQAYDQTTRLLTMSQPPSAIFACTDAAALSAIRAVRDIGLRVPQDVAVIGAGDILEGERHKPSLTTIGPKSRNLDDVTDLLFSRLAAEVPLSGRRRIRKWALKIRESA